MIVRINDIKHYYRCGYMLQCIFVMFASLLNCLLRTFLGLFVSVFDASILNFIQSLGDAVLALFSGLIGGMIEYMFRLMFGEQCKSYLFVYMVGSEIVVL